MQIRKTDVIFLFFCGFLAYGLWLARHTILLVYISIVFAIVFLPAARAIRRLKVGGRSPGRGTAVLILFACFFVVIGIVTGFMLPPILEDTREFARDMPSQLDQLSSRLRKLPLGERLAHMVNPDHVGEYAGRMTQQAFSAFRSVAGGIAQALFVMVLTAYFMIDSERTFRWAMSLVPTERRERLSVTLERAVGRAEKWLTGQLLLMVILGSASAVVFGLLHVRYYYALAVFAGVANFIPIVGPVATVLLAGLVAALDSGLKLVGVMIFYLVYQQIETAFLTPRIMRSEVGLTGVAVVVSLAAGGALAGALGALVAVPTAAMLDTLIDEYAVRSPNRPGKDSVLSRTA